jgi:hypothetical protein
MYMDGESVQKASRGSANVVVVSRGTRALWRRGGGVVSPRGFRALGHAASVFVTVRLATQVWAR